MWYVCKQNKSPGVNKKIQIPTVYLGLMIQQESSDIRRENALAAVKCAKDEKTASKFWRLSPCVREWKMEFPVSPL